MAAAVLTMVVSASTVIARAFSRSVAEEKKTSRRQETEGGSGRSGGVLWMVFGMIEKVENGCLRM